MLNLRDAPNTFFKHSIDYDNEGSRWSDQLNSLLMKLAYTSGWAHHRHMYSSHNSQVDSAWQSQPFVLEAWFDFHQLGGLEQWEIKYLAQENSVSLEIEPMSWQS